MVKSLVVSNVGVIVRLPVLYCTGVQLKLRLGSVSAVIEMVVLGHTACSGVRIFTNKESRIYTVSLFRIGIIEAPAATESGCNTPMITYLLLPNGGNRPCICRSTVLDPPGTTSVGAIKA
ncbi:hypothetical protein D3C72_1834380 [compost metagenome]